MNMNSNEVLTNLALEHLSLSKGKYEVIHPNDLVNQSQSINEHVCFDAVMRSVGMVILLDPILGHAKCDEMGKQCIAENKKISKRYWGQGLLTQELLGHIFFI